MSSHREAPEISKDPVADSTDLYAFVSPDRPDTVTLIANYIPLEEPAGGPNFYEFGNDVLYEIHIANDKDSTSNITFKFQFHTEIHNPNTFLYNTGPITSLNSPNWNRRQFYSVTMHNKNTDEEVLLGTNLACPPCNIGPRSTPDYASLAQAAIHNLPGGIKVFAGQRREGFYVDLGAIFDLGDLRPFQNLHLIPTPAGPGVDATKNVNVHSIAIQLPKKMLTRDGSTPTDVNNPTSVIGVYTSASRQRVKVHSRGDEDDSEVGPWMQVSRLGNPLFNEVIVPMAEKDKWNKLPPSQDKLFLKYVAQPELARLIPVLYPGVFPHLAALVASKAARKDLVAILLTGIPAGLIPGFQNFLGEKPADLLRLNMAIGPSTNPKLNGLLDGDLAGFPNGRRVQDDTVTIELRAIAGLIYPLIDPKYTPDGAAKAVTDGVGAGAERYKSTFPYLGTPLDGYDTPSA